MLTEQQAAALLEEYLREWGRHVDGGLAVVQERTVVLPYGWMFTYTSTRYAQSGATVTAVGHLDAVVVLAATGEVVRLGTSPGEGLARLEQERGLKPPVPAELQPFAKSELEPLSPADRSARCQALARVLTARIRDAPAFHHAVGWAVADLRALGHDLWAFDDDDDFEIWCPNYAQPSAPGLVLTFHPDEVLAAWSDR
ncbi:MAG TPA: hypothetical protein VLT45_20135 [Kofleriaceae bacterium]|nr:hypothetical protein [Kofleriaceae bacterium]